ncbi:MAG TPA: hypothetical protein VHY34_03180 [Caulobacteraceae bacterium]|jgi:hypothetical protein|nr:hypothetical protein [Caulobacteraceae bacterium]
MKTVGHGRSRALALVGLTAIAGLLAACATMPPEVPFAPDNSPDRAALTIFRERQFLNGAFDIMVRIDGKTVGDLKNGGQLAANTTPGDLKIAIQSEYDFRELVLPLHAEPGRDYYVEVLPRAIYLQQFAGGALNLPKDKAATAACNGKWCISVMSADEAKPRMLKTAGG